MKAGIRAPAPSLAQQFGAGDWEGKQANSDYVRKQFGLAVSRGPIFGLVARLVHQKGIDLVLSAADEIINPAGRSSSPAAANPRSNRRWSMRPPPAGCHRRHHCFNDGQARRIFCRQRFYPDAVGGSSRAG